MSVRDEQGGGERGRHEADAREKRSEIVEERRGRANTGAEDLKKCLSAGYPGASGFPEADTRINYEACSNSRTWGEAGGVRENWSPLLQSNRGHSLLSVLSVRPSVSLHPLRPPSPRRPTPVLRVFSTVPRSWLCLTSVAEFFRPAAIIAPRRSREENRRPKLLSTGVVLASETGVGKDHSRWSRKSLGNTTGFFSCFNDPLITAEKQLNYNQPKSRRTLHFNKLERVVKFYCKVQEIS